MLFQYSSSELHDTRHISYIFKHILKRHEKESQQNFMCAVHKQPKVNYSPTRISGGECFRGKHCAEYIRMDLQEVGCGYVDWIGLAQDRDGWRKLVNAVMNLRVA